MDNLSDLLLQMSGTQDATTKLLLQYLDQRQTDDDSESEADVEAERARRRRLERRALEFLRNKNLELSAAFGACPCWGEHARCPRCRGRGVPGWQPPDEELFMHHVEPVLRRLGIVIDSNQPSQP